ncbi:putative formate transporter, partial [Pasteurella multocida subsp. multocida str. Anand1_cattle]
SNVAQLARGVRRQLCRRTFHCVAYLVCWANYGCQRAMGINHFKTAQHKIHHTWTEAFALGIFCNIMVCIAVWMTYAGKTLLDKAVIMILPISMFVASGFEHSVANMFMIPNGDDDRAFCFP